MRNLLINLTFILALIICSSSDAFSQERGGNSMVDVFGRSFDASGINIDTNVRPAVSVKITEGKNDNTPIIEREFSYSFVNSSIINIPQDIDEQLDGAYYLRVYLNGILLGGEYMEF